MFSLNKDCNTNHFPSSFFTFFDFLSQDEINQINSVASHKLQLKASVVGDKDYNKNTPSFLSYSEKQNDKKDDDGRDSNVIWLSPDQNIIIKELFKKIINKIIELNEKYINFKLTDIETLQYTIYNQGQFYKKHVDYNDELLAGNIMRKLSFSIQLTDPSEYEGGELCGYVSDVPIIAEKKKGSLILFPSFLLHEVTPVTKGKRVSLVGWVVGPRFE